MSKQVKHNLLILLGLCVSLSLIGCGAGSKTESNAYISLSPAYLTLVPGQSGTLQVDITNLPAGEGITGYTISICFENSCGLGEEATGLDIQTTNCPAGTGTEFCEVWTITPSVSTTLGQYELGIFPSGESVEIQHNRIFITVRQPNCESIAIEWDVEETDSIVTDDPDNNCNDVLDPVPLFYTFTQTGCVLELNSTMGDSYTGIITNRTATLEGTNSLDGNSIWVKKILEFSEAGDTFSGSTEWKFTFNSPENNGQYCAGTSVLNGTVSP